MQSILHVANQFRNPIILDILLNLNAKIDILDGNNYNPLD